MKKIILLLLLVHSVFAKNTLTYDWKEGQLNFDLDTLKIEYLVGDKSYSISKEQEFEKAKKIVKSDKRVEFLRGEEWFSLEVNQDKIRVVYTRGSFPVISGDNFYLPIGHGKNIPTDDIDFINYYDNSREPATGIFSMSLFASIIDDLAISYMYDNISNNQVYLYKDNDRLAMKFSHDKADFIEENLIAFEIYVDQGDLVAIANRYRGFAKDMGYIKTLEEKEEITPDVKKLYGANHFYLWGSGLMPEDIINTKQFMATFLENYKKGSLFEVELIKNFEANIDIVENGTSMKNEFNTILEAETYYPYEQRVFLNIINYGMIYSGNYDVKADELYGKYKDYIKEKQYWGDAYSQDFIEELYKSGIKNAWIGLNSVTDAIRGELVTQKAVDYGYLIGPYDSYHSIHKPGSEDWETANFFDKSLYEGAAIVDKNGKFITGFLGRGRKLNPLYSFDSVRFRLDGAKNLSLNSWFIDCDGTGEIYDDYSKNTSQIDDNNNRIKRMKIIEKEYSKVIGTEGGKDIVASTVAFSHGLFTQPFGWGDKDMRRDKNSKYYVGKYYSPTGGIPSRYGKSIEIKEKFEKLIYDNKYNIPLYQAVYNDVIIATNHWEFDTLKVITEIDNLLIKGLFYNIPPLYHLDKERWNKHKELIVSYNEVFNPLHKELIDEHIVEFRYLDQSQRLQYIKYSNGTSMVANFSDEGKYYKGSLLGGRSILIMDNGDKNIYSWR